MFEEEYSRYWKTIIHTMMDGLIVVDPEGLILFTNEAFERLTGYRREELIGRSCEILGCDRCFGAKEHGGEMHCSLFKDGKVRHSKCTMLKKDGSSLHVLKNAAVLKDTDGVVVGGVETLTDLSELVARDQVITTLQTELGIEDNFEGIIGKSPAMHRVFDLIRSAAESEAPVIIYGESGTGKELVAGAVHRLSARSKGPFVTVNCAALNESLLESELFGHVKGAFTGADRNRKGRFEAAGGGTLFLDEIGDVPLSTQVKLLRVLQEKEIERVGDSRPVALDVRIISATNKNLNRLMDKGGFRDDLYYRIGVIPIYLPPLKERREDIPLLVNAFINRIRAKTGKPIHEISRNALEMLLSYDWPGNVREFINALEYAFVLCKGKVIGPEHLPSTLPRSMGGNSAKEIRARGKEGQNEKNRIMDALNRAGGKKTDAARILGISRVTLWKRLKTYGIDVDVRIRE